MQSITPFNNPLLTNSSSEASILQSTNSALNEYLAAEKPVAIPIRRYVKSLTKTTEVLTAEIALLTRECKEVKDVLEARKQVKTRKRLILKDEISISRPDLHKRIVDAENETKEKQTKRQKKVEQRTST